jgi:hypothetical protein
LGSMVNGINPEKASKLKSTISSYSLVLNTFRKTNTLVFHRFQKSTVSDWNS